MTLELVYWLTLGGGLGFLVLSLLIGDVLDVFDFEIAGTDFAAGPVFFAAASAFGAGGLLGIRAFEFGTGGSILLGIGTGAGMGSATAGLFYMLKKQEATDGFELSKLVGARGRCTVALGPGRVGRVTVPYGGMTRSLTAHSDEEIAAGEEVVVGDVIGNAITVSRPLRS